MAENTAYPAGRVGIAEREPTSLDRVTGRLNSRWFAMSLLAGVTLLAFALNAWNLSANDLGNTYYAAAVRSMTMSWKNFFFGAFDPGGFITVDKPPAFLWVGALSARIFGYSSWSILLPSAFAGAGSVALLWLIVRRWFGLTAATIAGLVLALTPITVATSRLNLPEPFLILALVGAAACVMQSLESKRWWAWTAGAGLLVGVAFNTKMLGAWIPGPAFAFAIVVAARTVSKDSAKRVFMRLAVLLVVTLIVSASWMAIVDAWPASDRPYVGGSTNNSEFNLATGYNGFGRVDGESQGPFGGGGPGPGKGAFETPDQGNGQFQPPNFGNGEFRPPNFGNGQFQPPNFNRQAPSGRGGGQGSPPGNTLDTEGSSGYETQGVPLPGEGGGFFGGGFGGAGGIIAGAPDLFRMFDSANGGQIGWLLPFALGGALLALWHWRRDPTRRAFAVLFLGWVLLFGGIFSYAQGIYHSYYTAALAPGIAALVGIGSVAVAGEIKRNPRWLIAAAALVGLTIFAQLHMAGRTPEFYGWVRPYTVIAAIAGIGLLAALALKKKPLTAGLAVIIVALLLIPGAWSISEASNATLNTTLPQAGPRTGASGQTFGSDAFDSGTEQLAAWLNANNDPNATWQLVVTSAQNASTLISVYGVSVLPIGGFSGNDNTMTVNQFADLVASGQVRYVETSGGFGPGGGFGSGGSLEGAPGSGPADGPGGGPGGTDSASAKVMSAVQGACPQVTDSTLPAGYTIYDCSGMADALRAGE
jgi:4-amino-4-deoxy-L-arabinose transferase-like glycosyltransferase